MLVLNSVVYHSGSKRDGVSVKSELLWCNRSAHSRVMGRFWFESSGNTKNNQWSVSEGGLTRSPFKAKALGSNPAPTTRK